MLIRFDEAIKLSRCANGKLGVGFLGGKEFGDIDVTIHYSGSCSRGTEEFGDFGHD